MKIRTQLVLACFLLSILPLSGIVLYSYRSSRDALETAYRNEAARATKQMDRRLAAIRTDLQERLAELSGLPLHPGKNAPGTSNGVSEGVMMALGETAKLVDSLELRPMAPAPPLMPAAGAHPAEPAAPVPAAIAEAAPSSVPNPPTMTGPMVINIPDAPKVPAFNVPEEQRNRIHEIGRLASALADSGALDAHERQQMEKDLAAAQKAFNEGMRQASEQFSAGLDAALKAPELDKRKLRLEANIARDEARRKREEARQAGTAPAIVNSAPGTPAGTEVVVSAESDAEMAKMSAHQKRIAAIFGKELTMPVRRNGEVVANLSAQIRLEEVIRRVLGGPADDGEVAFAADRDGNVYTRTADDRKTLDETGVSKALMAGAPLPALPNWINTVSRDPQTGVRIGVMRPVSSDLAGLRRAAAVNFSAGIALIVVALIGIMPVANHITRDVKLVTAGAERIALGDLTTRVPVKSHNEFGQLATAFNKMASDLSHHQQKIVEQERAQKEQELQQRMLEAEYSRKSVELEEARRFQLSMLPKELPRNDAFDLAVSTETATEVGGDYYDFHVAPDGTLSIAIGDATGHGAKAGTMITVAKTLFASYTPSASPSAFLSDAAEKIKRMEFARMAMSLMLARFDGMRMTIAAAGMPPVLVHRTSNGTIEEIAFDSTPLGTIGERYFERVVELAAGDTVLFMTDGLPELLNESGQQLGYPAAVEALGSAASASTAADVIASLGETARNWRGSNAPNDDITFVAVRVK